MTTESDGQPYGSPGGRGRPRGRTLACVVLVALTGCGGTDADTEPAAAGLEPMTLYTCVSDETIQPVIAAFEQSEAGGRVDLLRAPTWELNARVAADVRSGGLRADVFWGYDPLTVQALVDQDLVGGWVPPEAEEIPAGFRTDDYVGAHVLHMVAVHRTDVPAPATWADLAADGHAVAVPDPTVAASALGALGWFRRGPRSAGRRRSSVVSARKRQGFPRQLHGRRGAVGTVGRGHPGAGGLHHAAGVRLPAR